MISRRTTLLVADIICNNFTYQALEYISVKRMHRNVTKIETEKLRDFLFEYNVEGYTIEKLCHTYYSKEGLKDEILKMHTGMFYSSNNYKKYEKLGQSDIKNMAIGILSRKIQKESIIALENLLRIDGYIYDDEKLYEINTDIDDKINIIKTILKRIKFDNIKEFDTFYNNMNEHFKNSKWGDSIHNARRLYELVLKECAKYYSNNIEKTNKNFEKSKAVGIREYLEKVGFFSEDEINIVRYTYQYISNKGSHIKLAIEEQADFSRVLVINIILYSLRRLEQYKRGDQPCQK